jgi:cellobiose-specific phosphotransferase system component IIC
MKFQNITSKKPMSALKKSSIAALIPFLLTSSITIFITSTNVMAGPKGVGLECKFFDGKWKRIRSGIYSCAYGYQNYNVSNFKNNTIRICRPGDGCNVVAMHRSDSDNPKSEK